MPKVYANATMMADRPVAGNGSARVPGPSHDTEDAILKAMQARMNTAPFTAQHMAAFAAFAGITDRKTALDLHRHGVTWDDVNDYPDAGDINADDLATMKRLSQAGVRPAVLAQWHQMGLRYGVTVSPDQTITFATGRVSIGQAEPFYAVAAVTPDVRWAAADIVAFIGGHTSPQVARDFTQAGIRTASTAVYLHAKGCRPDTVISHRRNIGAPVDPNTFERTFTALYTSLSKALDRPALVRVAVANNATVAEALDWNATGESLKKIDLYMKARVSADEWKSDTTVREADEATLAMMAALNGHSGVTVAA